MISRIFSGSRQVTLWTYRKQRQYVTMNDIIVWAPVEPKSRCKANSSLRPLGLSLCGFRIQNASRRNKNPSTFSKRKKIICWNLGSCMQGSSDSSRNPKTNSKTGTCFMTQEFCELQKKKVLRGNDSVPLGDLWLSVFFFCCCCCFAPHDATSLATLASREKWRLITKTGMTPSEPIIRASPMELEALREESRQWETKKLPSACPASVPAMP